MYSNDNLKNQIEIAAKQGFKNLNKKYPREKFCGFGLYSDDGALTVCLAANSKNHLNNKTKKSPEDGIYYKWMTPEWKYENTEEDCFDLVADLIKDQHEIIQSESEFEEFRNHLFDACVQSLENLKREGLFGDEIVVFEVTDFDDEEKLVSWIKRLNTKQESEEFEALVNEE